jgi:3-oxoacyl-[acyl-carrier protein] reductase
MTDAQWNDGMALKFPEQAGIARFGAPEEVADVLSYPVSPAAKWMTRSTVRMDGGKVKGV